MEILTKAGEEYEYEPPSKYNREGYNTYKRMAEDPEEYVLFLRDPSVPPSNNALPGNLSANPTRSCLSGARMA
jgi:hypothetical protein